jgi:hypothetical protein
MIPTAYKDGKLYSVRPTDGDGDFTFSRGSNLAATRVASSGYIEKGRENLILQSNAITTSPWTGTRIFSQTQGHTGYDGSNDAWLIIPNSSNNTHYKLQVISVSNGIQTISVYAKAGGYDYFSIRDASASDTYGRFDLATQTTSTDGSNAIESKMVSLGGGWYRCSLTLNRTSGGSNNLIIYVSNAFGNKPAYAGDEVSGVYFQDFQVEQGLVATDYIETGATTAKAGILEDMPRLDYSGGATCPSLLLEPQRSNLMVQSEGFSTTAWTDNATDTNVTANATTSPEGLQNAAEIEFTSSSAEIYDQFTNVASSMHIGTMFLKNNGVNFVELELTGGAPSIAAEVTIDLRDGTLSNQVGDYTPTIEDYGNGWWRVAIGDTGTATIATPAYKLKSVGSNTGSFYAFGAQVEAGNYPTSYIPTYGSSVTRSVDVCEDAGSSTTFNDSEGVLFVEFSALADSGRDNQWRFLISDGTNNNRIQIGLPNATNNLYASCIASGVTSADMTHTLNNASSNHKVAIKYKANDFAMYVDGVEVDADTSGSTPTGLDIFDFYRTPNNNNYVEANVKQVIYFPTALTDTELASLTTL